MNNCDIRDQAGLSGQEVRELNFIKASGVYEFRKFYRSGLRSHIFEVLLSQDVALEQKGVVEDGIRIFPRARAQKMFRIFRSRFGAKEEIFQEIQRYKVLLRFLGPEFIALSQEFITDYRGGPEGPSILLCGLQEYVHGEILDPWRLSGPQSVKALLSAMAAQESLGQRMEKAMGSIATFTRRIRDLMAQTGYIPDLAGVGNLILTPTGKIKLVDINNIVSLALDNTIPLDDKGYPACDVSVQVLFILERELLGQTPQDTDPLCRVFLAPDRQARVRQIEHQFYRSLG